MKSAGQGGSALAQIGGQGAGFLAGARQLAFDLLGLGGAGGRRQGQNRRDQGGEKGDRNADREEVTSELSPHHEGARG